MLLIPSKIQNSFLISKGRTRNKLNLNYTLTEKKEYETLSPGSLFELNQTNFFKTKSSFFSSPEREKLYQIRIKQKLNLPPVGSYWPNYSLIEKFIN